MSGAYKYEALSRRHFEQVWRNQFERLFYVDPKTKLPLWLPDQVFRIRGKFMFYNPSSFFLRCDYYCWEEVLFLLGETRYVVVGQEFLRSNSEQIGISFQWDDNEVRDSGCYHIDWQPLEFFMFGKRTDWAIVSSESYNIMILCAKGDVFKKFSETCPGINRDELSVYLNHCPLAYRNLFKINYLLRSCFGQL